MSKLTAWSYSRLTGYETCPKKYYALSVAKTVKEKPSEHTDYGTQVHDSFAKYVGKGVPLPLALRQHKPLLDRFIAAPGEKLVEQKLALNSQFAATGWFDSDVYVRIINDLSILNGSVGILVDYKTGIPYDDFTQLRIAGAVMFLLAPELEKLVLTYLWLKNKTQTTDRLSRKEMPGVWASLMPRLKRYQAAHDKQEFPAVPGGHCRWCPVKTCPHNESR